MGVSYRNMGSLQARNCYMQLLTMLCFLAIMPFMIKTKLGLWLVAVVAILAILAVVAFAFAIFYPSSRVEAQRILVTDGDLYRVSSATGAYRLTNSKDIKILFDEYGNDLLVGKDLTGGLPGSGKVDGTTLYRVKNDTEYFPLPKWN